MQAASEACLIAKGLIDEFKAKHPHITSSSRIAQLIGIKQASINRIENLNANPSLELLTDIIFGTNSQHKFVEIMGRINPKIKTTLAKNLSHLQGTKPFENSLNSFASKEEYCLILLLACTSSGTTRKQIKAEFGAHGLKNLDTLVKEGILEEKNGIIKKWQTEHSFSQESVVKIFKICLENSYDESLFGLGENWCSLQTNVGDKLKTRKFVRSVLQKALNEIREEFESGRLDAKDKSNEDVFFVGMAFDSITKNSASKEKEVLQ